MKSKKATGYMVMFLEADLKYAKNLMKQHYPPFKKLSIRKYPNPKKKKFAKDMVFLLSI